MFVFWTVEGQQKMGYFHATKREWKNHEAGKQKLSP